MQQFLAENKDKICSIDSIKNQVIDLTNKLDVILAERNYENVLR